MHLFPIILATTASLVTAIPAAAPASTDLPCPKGYTQYKLNFNDLGKDVDGKTHGVRDNVSGAGKNIYGKLSWGSSDWQVANNGHYDVTNGFHQQNDFDMTTHQGQGALVTCQEYAYLRTNYDGERINLQSFWMRHQYAGAFNLEIDCDVRLPDDSYVTRSVTVAMPALPQGQYAHVQLTAAQQKSLMHADSCQMAVTPHEFCDPGQPCFGNNALMIDDLNYCWTAGA